MLSRQATRAPRRSRERWTDVKVKNTLLACLISLALLCASLLPAYAATEYHSGIFTYALRTDGTAEITGVTFEEGQTRLDIPEQLDGHAVTSIGYYAMGNYADLQSVTLPETLTEIGNGAFSLCRALTDINLPGGLKKIDTAAFFGCSSLKSVVIPQGVASIGNTAFRQCVSLESVSIPDSVTSIGKMAFFDCGSLSWIVLPQSIDSIGDLALGYYLDGEAQADAAFLVIGGSAAQSYAENNGLMYREALPYSTGDVNLDGKINIRDVAAIARHAAYFMQLTGEQYFAADTDGNGVVDINDATHLQRYLAEFEIILG